MTKLYLDATEINMKETGHGFTGSRLPRPNEGLTIEVDVDENIFHIDSRENYTICRYKDGRQGDDQEFRKRELKTRNAETG